MLDLIQTDGHVLMPRYRLVNGEPTEEFAKVGRNDASTFTGLWLKHDAALFKAIDVPVRWSCRTGACHNRERG
jgi:hypothetical protein